MQNLNAQIQQRINQANQNNQRYAQQAQQRHQESVRRMEQQQRESFAATQMQMQQSMQAAFQNSQMQAAQQTATNIFNELKQKEQGIINHHNSTIENLKNQYTQGFEGVNLNIKNLLNTNSQLVEKHNRIRSENIELQDKYNRLVEQFNTHAEQNQNLYNSVTELAERMEESNDKIDTLCQKCDSNIVESSQLDGKVGELSLKLMTCLNKEEETNEKLETVTLQMKNLQQIIQFSDEEKNKIIEAQNFEIRRMSDLFSSLFSPVDISDESCSNELSGMSLAEEKEEKE